MYINQLNQLKLISTVVFLDIEFFILDGKKIFATLTFVLILPFFLISDV